MYFDEVNTLGRSLNCILNRSRRRCFWEVLSLSLSLLRSCGNRDQFYDGRNDENGNLGFALLDVKLEDENMHRLIAE